VIGYLLVCFKILNCLLYFAVLCLCCIITCVLIQCLRSSASCLAQRRVPRRPFISQTLQISASLARRWVDVHIDQMWESLNWHLSNINQLLTYFWLKQEIMLCGTGIKLIVFFRTFILYSYNSKWTVDCKNEDIKIILVTLYSKCPYVNIS